ncbi:MAG: hypothetical protein PHO53_01950 [Actinomycetota bacterium]|nr:hypothetical protein [Actinomycetota bacterium]
MEIDTTRLKWEDWVALASSLVLLGGSFLPWYSVGDVGQVSGWDATKLSIFLMVSGVVGALVFLGTALGIDFSEEYAIALVTCGVASVAVVVVRIFVRQTGIYPIYGIYISLTAAIAFLASGVGKLKRAGLILLGAH